MKSLDFMIIGAQKAGTTALSHFLAQHPQIVMAAGKEVHLFDAPDYSCDWTVDEIDQRYSAYFEGASPEKLWGEATPIYLYWTEIIPELKRYNPALKLIVLLRDPAERAISHYEMEKVRANETLPLWLALLKEPSRLAREGMRYLGSSHRCHSYVDRGLYAQQLICLRQHFSDEQILVLDNAELKHDHAKTMHKVCRFLAIADEAFSQSEQVFSGNYKQSRFPLYYAFIKACLHWRFRRANQQLKCVLTEMGAGSDWHWLK